MSLESLHNYFDTPERHEHSAHCPEGAWAKPGVTWYFALCPVALGQCAKCPVNPRIPTLRALPTTYIYLVAARLQKILF